jgi:hypothetical protein
MARIGGISHRIGGESAALEAFDDQGNELGVVLDEKDAHRCAFAMSERCNAF